MNNPTLATSVASRISDLRAGKLSCSQSTLLGLADGLADSEYGNRFPDTATLRKASAGFRGGIGCTYGEGTCGALSGAVMALGFLSDNEGKATLATQELFNAFQQEFGSVSCGKIRAVYGGTHCTDCCLFAARKALELI